MRNGISQESMEKIESILEDMRVENVQTPILVEGKRDREALRTLGMEGEIITVNMGKSLSDLADFIASRHFKVIILTDWDRKGSYLAGKLFTLLRDNDVICNMEYRRKLGFYVGAHISSVEELASLF
ncbi:small primase-like protein with Toprim domain [Aciduliprofundum sp. MAR08-339]|uniref:toprim domain-containing protein n=1 Tax=Aciduliprofundum sp. (strain MAR08-339) TaxID=673860 RepID=UPI0002A4ACD3|nr:small primase-like protein with Toprim domain [Aciduliprofundum sp. MAR08-339]